MADDGPKVVYSVDVLKEIVSWILDAVDDALKVKVDVVDVLKEVRSVDVLKEVASWDTVSKVTDLI